MIRNIYKKKTEATLTAVNFPVSQPKKEKLSGIQYEHLSYIFVATMAEFILETTYPSRRIIHQTDNSSNDEGKRRNEFAEWHVAWLVE